MFFLGLALAVTIGISLGLLGAGGSILTVPLLVYVLQMPAKQAVAVSLGVVGTTALIGSIRHWRGKNVDLRAAIVFGALAAAGTYVGSLVGLKVSSAVQMFVFALAMLAAAGAMFRPPPKDDRVDEPPSARWPLRPRVLGTAVGVGLLTGLIGIGGGFLIVPALVVAARLPVRRAVGTSLLVIATNSAVGFASYATKVDIPWLQLGQIATVAAAGTLLGARWAARLSQLALRRAFGTLVLMTCVFVWVQNRGVFASLLQELSERMSMSTGVSWMGLLGGVLVGLAATWLLSLNGRVAGVSGIAAGVVSSHRSDRGWRIAFLAGLLGGGVGVRLLAPSAFGALLAGPTASVPTFALGGVLVGAGSYLANGCTSGHGVCGISRASPRSLVATAVFVTTGALVVMWLRHVGGLS